ncbi:hypothetical protein NDU88_004454, partial [Pleurodeles waltl]
THLKTKRLGESRVVCFTCTRTIFLPTMPCKPPTFLQITYFPPHFCDGIFRNLQEFTKFLPPCI